MCEAILTLAFCISGTVTGQRQSLSAAAEAGINKQVQSVEGAARLPLSQARGNPADAAVLAAPLSQNPNYFEAPRSTPLPCASMRFFAARSSACFCVIAAAAFIA
jgi:hypothetical protein